VPQNIYFDESGYTGNNLLHPDQKFFAYASVATDEVEAGEFVESIIKRYGIQNGELKGSKLVRFTKGRKAISEILHHFAERLKVSISDKKFALACKFHECIFEPCYSEVNSLFYKLGFHRFIANILYLEFVARGAGADEIFREFEELMRTNDESKLSSIFSTSVHHENSPIIVQIREFAQYRAEDIRVELASLSDSGTSEWILDLTNTSLYTLLSNWGTQYDQITAICDHSKPLQHDQRIFEAMINRRDRVFSDVFGESHPITFNLSKPIQFRDSKITHGIQIADVVAAAAVYVFSDANDEYSKKWSEIIGRIGHYGSMIPDFDEMNLNDTRTQRNAVLLMELHSRAKIGKSLVEGIGEYIGHISRRLITHPMEV
jgi:hypothetical protein